MKNLRAVPNRLGGPARTLLRVVAATLVIATVAVVSPGDVAASGAPVIGGVGPVTYTEGGDPVQLAPGITITGGGTFADGFIEFSIAGAGDDDRLFLPEGTTPDPTAGAITVIGEAVYLGLGGSEFKQIGTVGNPQDGQNGRPLRVNFSAALPNANFADGVDSNGHPLGWTINEQHITLGALASKTQGRAVTTTGTSAPYTVSGPGYSFQSDWKYTPGSAGWAFEGKEKGITNPGTFDSAVVAHSGAAQALRLWFSTNCPSPNNPGYCSVFGPDAWSSPFNAKAGDDLAFDWSAANGGDDYEVYGFLVNTATNEHTELMYGRGRVRGWTTSTGNIPADGNYRFRFVSGSYDATGGFLIGASLYIDNVRVLSSDATAAVAQAVARLVHYENTGNNPPSEISVEVDAGTPDGDAETVTVPTAVTLVDDPPTIAEIADVTFTNTMGATTFPTRTGTIPATDPEDDPISYSVVGGVADPTTIGGQSYTHSLAGPLGTLHLNAGTGAYAFVPDSATLDDVLSPVSDEHTIVATANGLQDSRTLTVRVGIQASAPGAPTGLGVVGDDGAAELSWTAPVWTGGSPITSYRIERSTDGGTSWTTVVASTGDTGTTRRVEGLTNGVPVLFRVSATNATGTGAPSVPASTTPRTVPDAPTALAAAPADGAAELAWTAPADDGGAPVTGYRIEVSTDGVNWAVAVADTGSTAATATVTGLANGTPVTFRVSAINVAGIGSPSTPASTTPRTVPGAPTELAAIPHDGGVSLSWAAPADDGGASISGYTIETSVDGVNWVVAVADTGSAATSAQVGGLANGTATSFRVSAINVAGTGPSSDPVGSTPRTVPGAPVIGSIVPGNRILTVHFTPPSDDGGAAVTGYEYSIDGGVTWIAPRFMSPTSPLVITPVLNGTTHPVRIRAVNVAGHGPSSNEVASAAVAAPVLPPTPGTPPAPTGTGVQLVDGEERPITMSTPSALTGDVGTPAGTLRFTDGDFSVELLGVDEHGQPLALDTQGRLIIVAGSYAQVSGEGFLPGSLVDVWLLSTPIHLGDVLVGPDGTFSARLPIPEGIAPGPHTVQMNGIAADGTVRTVSVGVIVRPAQAEPSTNPPSSEPTDAPAGTQPAKLAFTGGHALLVTFAALLMMLAGSTLAAGSRRRRSGR